MHRNMLARRSSFLLRTRQESRADGAAAIACPAPSCSPGSPCSRGIGPGRRRGADRHGRRPWFAPALDSRGCRVFAPAPSRRLWSTSHRTSHNPRAGRAPGAASSAFSHSRRIVRRATRRRNRTFVVHDPEGVGPRSDGRRATTLRASPRIRRADGTHRKLCPSGRVSVMRRLPLLVVLLVAVATSQALAADLDATLKKIKRSKTITLGYHESARPFSSGIQGVSNLEGKRVALIPGTTTQSQLTGALRKRNVTATIVPVRDHAAGIAALDDGAADAYASDRVILTGIGRTAKHPEKLSLLAEFFSYEPYGLMLRRDEAAFRLSVNRTLAQLYRSREIVPIFEKWFGDMSTAGPIIAAMYLINGLPE